MGEMPIRTKVKILTWIFLVFAAIFAVGGVAWHLTATSSGGVIKVHARHILEKVAPNAKPEELGAAKGKIEKYLEEFGVKRGQ